VNHYPWFIYPASKDAIWIYEGGETLTLCLPDDPTVGGNRDDYVFTNLDKDESLLKRAPNAVLDRLPKGMKEKHGTK
jgi:hypothetical protein